MQPPSDSLRHRPARGAGPVPLPPPPRDGGDPGADSVPPDLRIEEIEERHIPKDRNIFDK